MTLTLDELDSHLFKCADIIRDAVDPTDYKEFILPLVYYKTISDEFEKQYEQNLDDYGEDFARNPDLYDIPVVPEGHLWDDLRAVSDNVDQALNEAFDALTEENPELKGVFRADYIDADALDDDRLGRLVEHLSKHNLDRESVPPDMLGEAYMDLVRDFAEEEGKSGGQFFTPPHIVELCVKLVDDFDDGDEFHDPTVGSGGMLVEASKYYREQGGDPTKLRFTGQEINPDIAAIARMNLFIHGLTNWSIERQDSLLKPQFTDGDDLERFDYVLANFPFSADWAKDELQDDPYGRFDWHEKLPRADRGDYAFIMHMAKQLKRPDIDGTGGKAAIVIPHGVLFRNNEQRYRKPMLENDIVEAIVGLPDNLFQNNSIPSAILVLNTDKPLERENEVQFIHSDEPEFYDELSSQNKITDTGIEHIISNFREWTNETRVSQTVPIEEIRENNYNLNIPLYVDTIQPGTGIDVSNVSDQYEDLRERRENIESKLSTKLSVFSKGHQQEIDYTGESNYPSNWDIVQFEDIITDTRYGTDTKSNTNGDGYPTLRIPNVVSRRITTDDLKYTSLPDKEAERLLLQDGDILVIRTNGNPNYVGRCAVFSERDTDFVYASYLIRIRVDKSKVLPEYIQAYLNSPAGRSEMSGWVRSSAGNYNLSVGAIEKFNVPIPPKSEQKEIVEHLESIEDALSVTREQLEILTKIKAGAREQLISDGIQDDNKKSNQMSIDDIPSK